MTRTTRWEGHGVKIDIRKHPGRLFELSAELKAGTVAVHATFHP